MSARRIVITKNKGRFYRLQMRIVQQAKAFLCSDEACLASTNITCTFVSSSQHHGTSSTTTIIQHYIAYFFIFPSSPMT